MLVLEELEDRKRTFGARRIVRLRSGRTAADARQASALAVVAGQIRERKVGARERLRSKGPLRSL